MLAEKAGFCFGVNRAMELVSKEKNVFTVGPLIHNKKVVEKLKKEGVSEAGSLDKVKKGTFIIRTHGLPKAEIDSLKKKRINLIDATCPFVLKVQGLAKELNKDGFRLIVVGDKNHPEVMGIVDRIKNVDVVSSLNEAKCVEKYKKIGVVAQTTQSEDIFSSVVNELKKHTKKLCVYNTICSATIERQNAAKELAKKVDFMIVVGDRKSGNTKRLYEICRDLVSTVQIEDSSEIKEEWLSNPTIGVTAGASTPDWVIEKVLAKLKKKQIRFEKELDSLKKRINNEIKLFFKRELKETKKDPFLNIAYNDLYKYLSHGGKRFRPILLMKSYSAVGGKGDISLPALSVELLHNSTLVHDDVMDEDETRRGKPTVFAKMLEFYKKHKKDENYKGPLFSRKSSRFSVAQSICLGNNLVSLGAKCLLFAGREKEALRVYYDSYRIINEGQMRDVLSETKKISEREYINTALMKTGNLFSASIEIGAILGGATRDQRKNLKKYALASAVAFQLQDDLLDIEENRKGHKTGSDLIKGKKTLLVLKAMQVGMEKEKKAILKALGNDNASEAEVEHAIEALHTSGAVKFVNDLIKKHFEESKKHLKAAKLKNKGFIFFNDFADYIFHRKN